MNSLEKMEYIRAKIQKMTKSDLDISVNTLLADLGLDSLDIVELEMMYEEDFGVQLLESSDAPISVGDLLAHLK